MHFTLLSQFTRSSSFLSVSLLPVNFYSLLRYFNSSIHTHRRHILSTQFSKDSVFFSFYHFKNLGYIPKISISPRSRGIRISVALFPLWTPVFFLPLSLSFFFEQCFSVKPQFSLTSVKPRTLLQLLLKPPFFFPPPSYPTSASPQIQPPDHRPDDNHVESITRGFHL